MSGTAEAVRLPSLPEELDGLLDALLLPHHSDWDGAACISDIQAASSIPPSSRLQPAAGTGSDLDICAAAAPSEFPPLGAAWAPMAIKGEREVEGLSCHSTESTETKVGSYDNAQLGSVRRSHRQRTAQLYYEFLADGEEEEGETRRKVGRPIKYKGDPDAPHLTEQDRRMIKKRIANRESAQRNRMKRREKALTLHQQLEESVEQQRAMQQHIQEADHQYRQMYGYMQAMHARMQGEARTRQQLEQEVARLRGLNQLHGGSLRPQHAELVNPRTGAALTISGPQGRSSFMRRSKSKLRTAFHRHIRHS